MQDDVDGGWEEFEDSMSNFKNHSYGLEDYIRTVKVSRKKGVGRIIADQDMRNGKIQSPFLDFHIHSV